MIVGEVKPSRDAVIGIAVRGPSNDPLVLNAVVDTGFTDSLTLPADLVQRLGLPFRGTMMYEMANGAHFEFDLFAGQVEWDGRWREAIVAAADGGPLVGMGLLQGNRLTIDAVDGGRVEIRSLAQ